MLVLTLLNACAHAPRVPQDSEDPLNLGFETAAEEMPTGWSPGIGGYQVQTDTSTARTGHNSVRIMANAEGTYGSVSRRIDVAPLVGKQVRLHAWVKTEATTGWPVAWLRVDGGESTYTFSDGPLGTSAEWIPVVADAVITPGQDLYFGVAMGGEGTAWFDDLRLEVVEPPPVVPILLAGKVLDPAGTPVLGAEVSLIGPNGTIAAHTRSGADGGFEIPTTAGKWGISAVVPGRPEWVGAFLAQQAFAQSSSEAILRLGGEGGVRVEGTVDGPIPDEMVVQVWAYSDFDADVFAVPVGDDGRFAASLPRADRYGVAVHAGGTGTTVAIREGDVARATLAAVQPRPAPPAVLEWISQHTIPFSTVDPDAVLDDPAGLRALVGDAEVVALGEATHGTREFFQLKDRVFRSLVADQGFTVFALEIGQTAARLIDAYIQTGTGTARTALGAAGMWLWETEELLAQVEWMRAWNADPAHTQKVHFVGFDAQNPVQSFVAVRAFLQRVAPDDSVALLGSIEVLGHDAGLTSFEARPEAERTAVLAAVAALEARFDASRGAWEAAASPHDFEVARQDARNLYQAAEQFALMASGKDGSVRRDEAMAENILWLHKTLPPGARMVVSAHNLHIADIGPPDLRMGHPLRAALGPKLRTIGLELGDGTFQALRSRSDGAHMNIEAVELPPPPPGQVSDVFLTAGPPVFGLDLRGVPETGEVAAWFRSPQFVREVGYVFRTEALMTGTQTLPDRYDAVLFVAHTTRARPLAVDFSRLP